MTTSDFQLANARELLKAAETLRRGAASGTPDVEGALNLVITAIHAVVSVLQQEAT